MKKLLGIVVLVLMWCNIGIAEQVEFSCKVGSFDLGGLTSEDKQRFKKKTIKLLIDTDEMKIYNDSEDGELSVISGIEYVANLNTGIDTSVRVVPKAIKKTSEEDEKIEKQPIIKTKEELLLEYKEILFKYPLTEAYRDFIELEDGSKITFEQVKNFSEREFRSMRIADPTLKKKLKILYDEFKVAFRENKQSFIDNKKKIEKQNKKKLEKKWGKVFHYLSGKNVYDEFNNSVHYLYKGHVYWGGYKRKGFVVEIFDPQVKGTKIKIGKKIFYKKKNLINFFDRQIQSTFWSYQFNFNCK